MKESSLQFMRRLNRRLERERLATPEFVCVLHDQA
jgi:hypothetical protein